MAVFAVLLAVIPALTMVLFPSAEESIEAVGTPQKIVQADPVQTISPPVTTTETSAPTEEKAEEIFLVLDTESGDVLSVSARDYVIGAVCAEVPASFHPEALKAQAVAAHTYAVRQREQELISPTESLHGAYFSNDSRYYQAYFTEEQARKFYGDSYEENYEKIASAVDEVLDEIIVYESEPIVAAFHSMSGGVTESAEVIWGSEIDYLIPVESNSDTEVNSFTQEYKFTPAEIKARVSTSISGVNFNHDTKNWLIVLERSSSGTVTSMEVGDAVITGTQFREIMSLRSANFTVSYTDGNFVITTKGYGHGVGLSQYGADAMARSGSDYREILAHYYPSTDIITLS